MNWISFSERRPKEGQRIECRHSTTDWELDVYTTTYEHDHAYDAHAGWGVWTHWRPKEEGVIESDKKRWGPRLV